MNEKENANSSYNALNLTESVSLIKKTIDKSKYNLRYLYSFLFLWGALTFFVEILKTISLKMFSNTILVDGIFIIVKTAVIGALFAYYYIKRKKEISADNIYGLQIYDIWGVSVFLPVIMRLIKQDLYPLSRHEPTYEACIDLIEVMLIIIAIYLTGIFLKNRIVVAASLLCVVSIFVYICICFAVKDFKVETIQYYSYFVSDTSAKALTVYSFACAVVSGLRLYQRRSGNNEVV